MHQLLMELFWEGISVYIIPVLYGDEYTITISLHKNYVHVRSTFTMLRADDEVLMMMEIKQACEHLRRLSEKDTNRALNLPPDDYEEGN